MLKRFNNHTLVINSGKINLYKFTREYTGWCKDCKYLFNEMPCKDCMHINVQFWNRRCYFKARYQPVIKLLPVGAQSILWGVHHWLWHPLTIALAWRELYGNWPSWREAVCIFLHDLGYLKCKNMDGKEGIDHPELGANLAFSLFGKKYYYDLCLFHSGYYAEKHFKSPSRLCWADKYSIKFEPWWFYIPRAWLSGELAEYRNYNAVDGIVPHCASHREWFNKIREIMINRALSGKNAVEERCDKNGKLCG